jgi:two-component system KDP operon response regulator KdpE
LVFESWGYDVNAVATGELGVSRAAGWSPHVVLLDVGLPGMQGEEVATALKAFRSPPYVIAYSGFERREAAAREAGCDTFIVKPSLERLAALLAAIDHGLRVRERSGA